MRWDPSHKSDDHEDRRGEQAPSRGSGGGLGGVSLLFNLFARFGWKGLLVGGLILAVVNSADLCSGGGGGSSSSTRSSPSATGASQPGKQRPAEENTLVTFVAFVFDDAQAQWKTLLPGYRNAKLVTFTGATNTGCGYGEAAVGPFYCPMDQKVYIDVGFYRLLRDKLGAPGDFAQAYVIAHEVGHHIQWILGTSDEVNRLRQRLDKVAFNRVSVRMELQADFYAGVWAHYAEKKGLLEMGDLEEAMNAASKIGDDHLQKQAQGRVVPDAFTHGTSAQRMAWFRYGYQTGDWTLGNTFDDAVFARVNPR